MMSNLHYKRLKALLHIIFIALIHQNLIAQNKIKGNYNATNQVFETSQTKYWIGAFKKEVAPISKGGFFGLMDTEGNVLCRPKYDKIFAFNSSHARVCRDGRFGLISIDGTEILPPEYYFISNASCERMFAQKERNGQWDLLDHQGRKLLNQTFTSVSEYHNGFATCIDMNSELVILNKDGATVYRNPLNFSDQNSKRTFRENFWIANEQEHSNLFASVDFNEQKMNQYNLLFQFNNGQFVIPKQDGNGELIYGAINGEGEILVPFKFKGLIPVFNNAWAYQKKNKWGVMDLTQNVIIPESFEAILPGDADHIIARNNENSVVLNRKNDTVKIVLCHDMYHLVGSLYAMQKNEAELTSSQEIEPKKTWQIIDLSEVVKLNKNSYDGLVMINDTFGAAVNQTIIKRDFDESPELNELSTTEFGTTHLKFVLSFFNEHGFTDLINVAEAEKFIFANQLSSAFNASNLFIGAIEDKYYMFSENGDVIGISDRGTKLNDMALELKIKTNNGLMVIRDSIKNHFGIADYNGEIIVSPNLEYVSIVETGIVFQCASKYGFMDLTGNVLLEPNYSEMSEMNTGSLMVRMDKEAFMINRKGEKI